MKRRIFAVILSCLMVLSLIPFAAFATDEEHVCDYTITLEVIIKPSCTNEGLAYVACTCGATTYDVLPMHDLDDGEVEKEATCTETGTIIYSCQAEGCGYKETRTLEMLDHDYITTYVAATCYSGPRAVTWCKYCKDKAFKLDEEGDKVLDLEMGKPIDHDFAPAGKVDEDYEFQGNVAFVADCVKGGYDFQLCIYCKKLAEETELEAGEELSEETIAEILRTETLPGDDGELGTEDDVLPRYWKDPAGHDWKPGVQSSTACKVEGCNNHKHFVFTCNNCAAKTIDKATDVNQPDEEHEHSFTDWTVTKKASCYAAGKKNRECTHCGYVETKTIAKRKHKLDSGYTHGGEAAATCNKTAYAWNECQNGNTKEYDACSYKEYEKDADGNKVVYDINPNNHGINDDDDYEVLLKKLDLKSLLDPTCTAEGLSEGYCKNCKQFYDFVITRPSHTVKEGTLHPTKDYSCTVDGEEEYICAVCEETVTRIVAADCRTTEEVLVPATCTSEGKAMVYCTVCGDRKDDKKIEKLPHRDSEVGTYAPTCTRPGIVNGTYCLDCGQISSDKSTAVGEPIAHDFDVTYEAADCWHAERAKFACKNCSYVEYEDVENGDPQKEHVNKTQLTPAADLVGLPSCTKDKVVKYKCDLCGEFEEVTKAEGHNWDTKETHFEATCVANGYYAKVCLNGCGAISEKVVIGEEAPNKDNHRPVASKENFLLAPDCSTGAVGMAYVICADCGAETVDAYTNLPFVEVAPQHKYEAIVVLNPECYANNSTAKNGEYDYKCTVCNNVFDKKLDANGQEVSDVIVGKHDFTSWTTVAGGTACGGVMKARKCNACGYEETDVQTAGNGKHVTKKIPYAKTCTSDARVDEVCEVCAFVVKSTPVPDNDSIQGYYGANHDEKPYEARYEIVGATCELPAIKYTVCVRCNERVDHEALGETGTGHSAAPDENSKEWIVVDATCEKPGSKSYVCEYCDEPITTILPRLACALRKDEGAEKGKDYTLYPTCKDAGYYYETCANCGEHLSEELYLEVADANHENADLNHWTVNELIPKTCTTKGLDEWICKHCGISQFHVIDEGHEWSEEGVRTEPVCEGKVDLDYTCTVCGAIDEEDKPEYVGHDYDDGVVTTEPTCTVGIKTFTCTVEGCGETTTEEIPAVEEHEFGTERVIIPATCQSPVLIGIVCVNCGAPDGDWEYRGTTTNPHNIKTEMLEATCDTPRSIKRTCQNEGCDYSVTEVVTGAGAVAPLGHLRDGANYTSANGKHSFICIREGCGKKISENCYERSVVLYPVYHKGAELPVENLDATCLRAACQTFTCFLCKASGLIVPGSVGEGEKDPDNHAYDMTDVILEPTCSTYGIAVKTCSCGANPAAKYEPVAPHANHEYGDRKKFTNPEDKTSVLYFECAACSDIKIVASTIVKDGVKPSADNNFNVSDELIQCLLGKHVEAHKDPVSNKGCNDGHNGYTYCEVCKTVLSDVEVLPAEHNYVIIYEGFNAENGTYYIVSKCQDCQKSKTETFN